MSTPRTPPVRHPVIIGSNPVAASADGKTRNTLGINMVRLPIGHSAEDPRPAGPRTMFWLVIPTNTGGRLICKHEGGGILTLLAHDGKTKIGGDFKPVLDIAIHPKSHGLMYVAADDGSPRKVSARFVQVGVSREGTSDRDKPLIPWNFWYYPSARTFHDGTVNADAGEPEAIIRKYVHAMKDAPPAGKIDARAVRMDPKEVAELADKAVKWEHDNHGVDVGPTWFGHCHNAAGASIVFEQPVARTVNGQSFTGDELELIAAELFGNVGSARVAFALRGTAPGMGPPQMFSKSVPEGLPFESDADEKREARPVFTNGLGNLFYPMCFKPSEAKNANIGTLARALKAFDPTLGDSAVRLARQAFATMNVQKLLDDWFGELAAQFYFALVECILKGKHALEGDLASQNSVDGPEQVWNHAVFHYVAEFVETNYRNDPRTDTNDPHDVTLTIDLTANDDFRDFVVDPATGAVTRVSIDAPAGIAPNGTIDFKLGSRRRTSRQVLRLMFDDAGEISFDARNEWISARNLPNTKDTSTRSADLELYAPRYLAWMSLDFSVAGLLVPPNLGQLARGNIVVQLDAISGPEPLLTFRKRFRP